MNEAQKQALNYLAQVAADHAATLAPSVRGPFVRECQSAIKAFEAPAVEAPVKTDEKPNG